jgi:hypothetical protein
VRVSPTERAYQRAAGAALVSVLLVLVAILILALGTLMMTNSSLMIAENQVSASIARAHAEAGIDAVVASLTEAYHRTGALPPSPPPLPRVTGLDSDLAFDADPSQDGVPWYSLLSDDTVRLRVVGRGPRDAEYVAEAVVAFHGGVSTPSPFKGMVVACERAQLAGSGRIDSFDSRVGYYDPQNPGSSAHVYTLNPPGTVEIRGGSPMYGDVISAGGVRTTGSAKVYGDVYASGLVDLAGGGSEIKGNVRTTGDVRFGSSANVYGSLYANGSLDFQNWSAYVHGDAHVGGGVSRASGAPSTQHHIKGALRENDSPAVPPVPREECDPVDIKGVIDGVASLPSQGPLAPNSWPYKNWVITPEGVLRKHEQGDWEDAGLLARSATLLGREMKVISVSSLDLRSGVSTRVSGGHVVLLVDGDFLANGGNHKLYIDPGSTLTVLVTGVVSLGASFEVLDGSDPSRRPLPVTADGLPTFSVFSSYTGKDGVRLATNGKLVASVYAPFTDVLIAGSGEIFGSMRAGTLSIEGSGALHYDVALGDVDLGHAPAAPGEATVRILSRR